MTNKKDKRKKVRYNAEGLKKKKDKTVTMSFNKEDYETFKQVMEEQGLKPSSVLNQFMVLTNDLLTSEKGGEVAFVFEPHENQQTKKEESPKES